MNYLLLFTSLFIGFLSSAQVDYSVKFGQEEKTKKRIQVEFLGIEGENLFYYKERYAIGGYQKLILQVDKHSLEIKKELELEFDAGYLQQINFINGRIITFMEDTDRRDGKTRLYFHSIVPDNLTWEKLNVEIASIDRKKGLFSKSGGFEFLASENKKTFAVWFDLPYEKDQPEKFGIAIYDEELKRIKKKDFQLSELDKNINIGQKYLSNEGDLYFAARQITERTLFGSTKEYLSLFFQVTDAEELERFEFSLAEKRLIEYTFMLDPSGKILVSGLYGPTNKLGIEGAFYARIDPTTKEIEKTSFQGFAEDFITEGWTDKQKNKSDRKKDKGKGEPQLQDYDIRSLITLQDNSAILVAEQYFVVVRTYTDAQGNTRTTYSYYYNSIIVIRINPEGELVWCKKIPKAQVSSNDEGYYSSYAYHVGEDAIYFVFNDDTRNYVDGDAKGGTTYRTSYGNKKRNVVSIARVDLTSGNFTKQELFSRMDIGMLVVAKAHFSDQSSNKLYFYARAKKSEKVGMISF